VSVQVEHATQAVEPLGQIVVATGRQIVSSTVAGATGRPDGEEMVELGGPDGGGHRDAVDQFRAATDHDATALAFQRLVVIVTEQRRGGLLVVGVVVQPERQRRRRRSVQDEVSQSPFLSVTHPHIAAFTHRAALSAAVSQFHRAHSFFRFTFAKEEPRRLCFPFILCLFVSRVMQKLLNRCHKIQWKGGT